MFFLKAFAVLVLPGMVSHFLFKFTTWKTFAVFLGVVLPTVGSAWLNPELPVKEATGENKPVRPFPYAGLLCMALYLFTLLWFGPERILPLLSTSRGRRPSYQDIRGGGLDEYDILIWLPGIIFALLTFPRVQGEFFRIAQSIRGEEPDSISSEHEEEFGTCGGWLVLVLWAVSILFFIFFRTHGK